MAILKALKIALQQVNYFVFALFRKLKKMKTFLIIAPFCLLILGQVSNAAHIRNNSVQTTGESLQEVTHNFVSSKVIIFLIGL